ncbi:MAG: DUF1800 family protein [Verrucomicrobiota bacterium]|jgi:uncharacterized protein (DUF1800 family)
MQEPAQIGSRKARPEDLDDPSWAWAPYRPDGQRPWSLELAAHLYRRGAFGANWGELEHALADGPELAVSKLLRPKADVAPFNRAYDAYEKAAAGSADGVPAWWLRRLLETPHPVLEQMTLFWHNHFAITNARVKNPAMMCRYLQLLRRNALGRFDALLESVLDEPAVLICLGARANRKARPCLDGARALMEQWTLGPGRFSEPDVQGAARAWTGWFVSQDEAHYIPREHDSGAKKLLGREGDFDRKDLLRLLLEQPATAQLLVRKLYRWFVSETVSPPDALVAPLAADFAKDFDLARLLETVLRSNLFFCGYRQKIKSPVQFAVGLVRALEGTVGTVRLASDLADLGQDLFQPPTLKGWAGGQCWINRFMLPGRAKLAEELLAGSGPYGAKLDPAATASKYGQSAPGAARRFLVQLFFQGDLPEETRQALLNGGSASDSLRGFGGLLAALPEWHLA